MTQRCLLSDLCSKYLFGLGSYYSRRETPDLTFAFPFPVDDYDYFGSRDFGVPGRPASASPPMPRQSLQFLNSSRSQLADVAESVEFRTIRQYVTGEPLEMGDVIENLDFARSVSRPPQVCVRRGTSDSVTGGLHISFTRSVGIPPATPDIENYLGNEQQTPAGVVHGVHGFSAFPLQENRKRRRTTGGKTCIPNDSASSDSFRFRVDFENISLLGRGSFSEVFRATHRLDKTLYAIKRSGISARSRSEKEGLEREARVLAKLSGRNDRNGHIVQYFTSWFEEGRLHIQMELCGRTVSERIRSAGRFSVDQVKDLLMHMAAALRFCHQASFVHLDVKPDNIFLVAETVFKLGDFGLAQEAELIDGKLRIAGLLEPPSGDARYLAREVLSGQVEDVTKVDMFALGASAIECLSGRQLPADGPYWHRLRDGLDIEEYFQGVDNSLVYISRSLTNSKPSERPSASDLAQVEILRLHS